MGSQKLMRAVAFYVRRTAKHRKSGETSFSSFGPFGTYEEAQAKRREDEARPESEYEYDYRIIGYLENALTRDSDNSESARVEHGPVRDWPV